MSATNRGGQRHPDDFYATPAWCVRGLLDCVDLAHIPIVDPCAGTGAIIRALAECGLDAMGIEASQERAEDANSMLSRQWEQDPQTVAHSFVIHGDGLARSWRGNRIVINPPFKTARLWIEKGLREAVSMSALLRLGFLASRKRADMWSVVTAPDQMIVLSSRPSFTGNGTDSCDYAWYHWDCERVRSGKHAMTRMGWCFK